MTQCKGQHMGELGNCICIKCNTTVLHIPGNPCKKVQCPNCDSKMMRENSEHHKVYLKKNAK